MDVESNDKGAASVEDGVVLDVVGLLVGGDKNTVDRHGDEAKGVDGV